MSELSKHRLSDREFMRYAKQLMLPRFGERGQLMVKHARVAIVGVGGLGQQVLQLLSAAGIGEIIIIDPDRVALGNLPRQLLYRDADIGTAKVSVAQQRISERYPATNIIAKELSFGDSHHAELAGCHLIMDCSDNFSCRHALNRAAVSLSIALISGAISADSGLVGLFSPKDDPATGCYQCLFPDVTTSQSGCSSMGVLGPAVAVIASLQSQWALNYLLDEENRCGQLVRFNAQSLTFHQTQLRCEPDCPVCGSIHKETCI